MILDHVLVTDSSAHPKVGTPIFGLTTVISADRLYPSVTQQDK